MPALVWLVGAAAAVADDAIIYSSVVRTEPRPLRIHVLKLDLESHDYQPVVVVNADPDGDGLFASRPRGGRELCRLRPLARR
jgi:hypothetical protein